MSEAGQSRLGYIAAHGTGTPLGDPIETGALAKARQTLGGRSGSMRSADALFTVGGVKTLVGHLEGTAGLAGVLLAVMHMQQSVAPALRYRNMNPFVAASLTSRGVAIAQLPNQVHPFAELLVSIFWKFTYD